jgi:hypothetical protein
MGKALSQSIWPIFCAVAVAAVLLISGLSARKTLLEKATQEDAVIASLLDWKEKYLGLQPTEAEWVKTFVSYKDNRDIRALINVVDLRTAGLTGDTDYTVVSKVEKITGLGSNSVDLGLTKICLGMNGQPAFVVKAPTYHELIDGIHELAGRRDLLIGSIDIKGNGAMPSAALDGFCILVRSD